MPTYYKLIRDKIPEIIEASGKAFSTRILNQEEYSIELKRKLLEEAKEYQETSEDEYALEELADILELVHAAAIIHNSDINDLEKIRKAKCKKRGGFGDRIFLEKVED
ncbi:MAG TPA: nucleoside triphosphate pyrophosphohydrolase [Pseudogracilibacillus sp.]|nr:nucleoside triphosphate pyrophosphohydrolase [Pseudogracilibacillus sp.]